jgi:hypothetical protein
MYVVLMLDEIFRKPQLDPFDLLCHLGLGFLCGVFVWMTYLLVIEGY